MPAITSELSKRFKALVVAMSTKKKSRAYFEAERLRLDALEWLRNESLWRRYTNAIAVLKSLPRKHQGQLMADAFNRELLDIDRGKHHWMIKGRSRLGTRVYPFLLPDFRRSFAATAVSVSESFRPAPGRLYVSIDPAEREKDIMVAIKNELRVWKKQRTTRIRADGGGRDKDILKMLDALRAHDELQNNSACATKTIGWRDDDSPEANNRTAARRGQKLKDLASEMLRLCDDPPAFMREYL